MNILWRCFKNLYTHDSYTYPICDQIIRKYFDISQYSRIDDELNSLSKRSSHAAQLFFQNISTEKLEKILNKEKDRLLSKRSKDAQ